MRCKISGVSGMGSLPLLPLALEEVDVDPSLRMPELRGSLYLPLDTLPWSPSGSIYSVEVIMLLRLLLSLVPARMGLSEGLACQILGV